MTDDMRGHGVPDTAVSLAFQGGVFDGQELFVTLADNGGDFIDYEYLLMIRDLLGVQGPVPVNCLYRRVEEGIADHTGCDPAECEVAGRTFAGLTYMVGYAMAAPSPGGQVCLLSPHNTYPHFDEELVAEQVSKYQRLLAGRAGRN